MKKRIKVIPDIHGRNFWHECLNEQDQWDQFVFLGDYTDPYKHEGLTGSDVVSELEHVISFKLQNPEKVILLIGNHDLQYFFPNAQKNSRYDRKYAATYKEMFQEHQDLFQLVHEVKGEKKTYVFSHAGITQGWLKDNLFHLPKAVAEETFSDLMEPLTFLPLNKLLNKESCFLLDKISYYRGGENTYGSLVWADIHEWDEAQSFPGFFQIFGHTQLEKPFETEDFICIDCRQCYEMNI